MSLSHRRFNAWLYQPDTVVVLSETPPSSNTDPTLKCPDFEVSRQTRYLIRIIINLNIKKTNTQNIYIFLFLQPYIYLNHKCVVNVSNIDRPEPCADISSASRIGHITQGRSALSTRHVGGCSRRPNYETVFSGILKSTSQEALETRHRVSMVFLLLLMCHLTI